MVKIIFAIIILIHALIHLMGFVKEWEIARLPEMTGKTLLPLSPLMARVAGILWLAACILFVLCGIGFISGKEWWMIIGVIGAIISQAMIILYWRDAWAGTIANLILVIGIILAWGALSFSNRVAADVKQISAGISEAPARTVTRERLAGLPKPVERWLAGSGIVGRESPHSVRLTQMGMMRTKPEQDTWMDVTAEQYITMDAPAFIWKGDIKMKGIGLISARDRFADGRGRMTIKLLSLVTMEDAAGEKIDQAAMQRFLVEMAWYPWAALAPYVRWEPIDSRSARVSMSYKGVSGSCVFHFDETGDVVGLSADRYMGGGKKARLEKWVGTTRGYGTMDGIRMPVKIEVAWKLREGDFTWFKFEIERLDYDRPFVE